MGAKSIFTDKVWDEEIGPRYMNERHKTARAMAAELGVSKGTLETQMRKRGFFRQTPRESLPANFLKGTAAPETRSLEEARAALMGFEWDPERPDLSMEALIELGKAACRLGRLPEFREILRCIAGLRAATGAPLPYVVWPEAAREALDAGGLGDDGEPGPELVLRTAQKPPEEAWSAWLFLGGRGAGKTLAGASWAADEAERLGPGGRLALVGATLHDVREVMIGGPSGINALPRWRGRARPVYESTRRRLVFPSGAEAWAFSAEDPDSLRGPQFAGAWADEFCAWARPDETLAMLRLGLRLGRDPRLVVTTTPRPMAALKALRAEAGCVTTHAPTRDNAEHLAPGVIARLEALYGGTRRAAQEMEGLILDVEGALFRAEDLARANLDSEAAPERFDRVVVAIDPTTTPGGDACGIVAAGRVGTQAYVLADRSMRGLSPDGWARRALACAAEFGAGAIVAEVNQGGDMVAHVLKTLDPEVVVREVRATRGKRMRAEPVAALYEQGRVTHLGRFRDLEEELMALGGDETGSLDRADALVWALTDLMLGEERQGPWFRVL